jgi:hypothetical protein
MIWFSSGTLGVQVYLGLQHVGFCAGADVEFVLRQLQPFPAQFHLFAGGADLLFLPHDVVIRLHHRGYGRHHLVLDLQFAQLHQLPQPLACNEHAEAVEQRPVEVQGSIEVAGTDAGTLPFGTVGQCLLLVVVVEHHARIGAQPRVERVVGIGVIQRRQQRVVAGELYVEVVLKRCGNGLAERHGPCLGQERTGKEEDDAYDDRSQFHVTSSIFFQFHS